MLRYCIPCILLLTLVLSASQAQTIKGTWQKVDSLELIEDGVFAAASDQVAYYMGPDKGWKTTDGGHSWNPITFPSSIIIGPSSIFTYGSTILLFQQRVEGAPIVVRSTDEGANWEIVNDSLCYDNLKTVSMWSPTGLHVISVDGVGTGRSYVSNDGGVTFEEGRSDATLQKYIATSLSGTKRYTISTAWSDSLNGIITLAARNIATPTAHILLTHDAGASWKEMLLPNRNDTTAIPGKAYTLPGTPYIWVTVTDLTRPGCYYFSTDYGETWRVSQPIFGRPLELLSPVDTSTVWALFSAVQYPELNQNKTFVNQGVDQPWSQIFGLPAGNRALSVNYLKFFSATEGWATGTRVNQTGTLYYYIYRFIPQSSVAVEAQTKIQVYPSPASDFVTLTIGDDRRFRSYAIRDVLGKDLTEQILSIEKAGSLALDLRQLPYGTYVVTLKLMDGSMVTTKITRQ